MRGGSISDSGDDDNGSGGGDGTSGSGSEGNLYLLLDGDGGSEDGDDGDNLALLRGGAAISSTTAASITDEKIIDVRIVFLRYEPRVARQPPSNPHLTNHPKLRGLGLRVRPWGVIGAKSSTIFGEGTPSDSESKRMI
ncbi:hypothetical protein Tco_0854657 [Tanacetum coccineum]